MRSTVASDYIRIANICVIQHFKNSVNKQNTNTHIPYIQEVDTV